MDDRYAVVITTINHPTRAVSEIVAKAGLLSAEVVIIGDSKSPADFHQEGASYWDLAAQQQSGFRYGEVAPIGHYARKNVGYLVAVRNGSTIIIETDDDNIPIEGFWSPREHTVHARTADSPDWINVYAWYADAPIWPRGLPLDVVKIPPPALNSLQAGPVYCPIQQGLADGDPDVDAIYRLVMPLPFTFRTGEPVALMGAWCPFNSQNTTFFRDAFPLLYLPYHCSFRMTDIWRSFVAQRIAYQNGWGVLFHGATVFQERNEHRLLRDFEEEIPGYLNNQLIREALDVLALPSGVDQVPAAMKTCYERLVAMGLIGREELFLLDVWLTDLADAQQA